MQELDTAKIDLQVQKGMDERIEMYSVFADSFGNLTAGSGGVSHDLANVLKQKGVSDVYVAGLAGDYCVKSTAIDAAKAGFNTFVVEEGTRCVDPQAWVETKQDLQQHKVGVISVAGPEIEGVRALTRS